jgi:hypothetical protein
MSCVNCASVSPQVTGMTPLMYAVKDNRAALLDRMIELGADVCARNNVSTFCCPRNNGNRHAVWREAQKFLQIVIMLDMICYTSVFRYLIAILKLCVHFLFILFCILMTLNRQVVR